MMALGSKTGGIPVDPVALTEPDKAANAAPSSVVKESAPPTISTAAVVVCVPDNATADAVRGSTEPTEIPNGAPLAVAVAAPDADSTPLDTDAEIPSSWIDACSTAAPDAETVPASPTIPEPLGATTARPAPDG